MARPWKTLDQITTGDGELLELRQRGERDFIISIGPMVLMNSMAQRSEIALGKMGCKNLKNHTGPRVLVGGLGMGCTLRGVLDSLPENAEVVVAELNPEIVKWCKSHLFDLTQGAVCDPRVVIHNGDVAKLIKKHSHGKKTDCFDAIILDLYRGPHPKTHAKDDPFYGSIAIKNAYNALKPNGTLAVWGEQHDEGFLKRLNSGGFKASCQRPGKGGYRHAVFLALKEKRK